MTDRIRRLIITMTIDELYWKWAVQAEYATLLESFFGAAVCAAFDMDHFSGLDHVGSAANAGCHLPAHGILGQYWAAYSP